MLANCTSDKKVVTIPVEEIDKCEKIQEVIVFVGNPGVGKSSLINAIIQEPVFKSGVSIGIDLTRQEQFCSHGDKLYIDTPGIDDINLKQQAACEIEKALKHNTKYKILFVVTLTSGRIRPADIVTINTVCESIRTDFEYGLIINRLTEEVMKKMDESQGIMKLFKGKLCKQPSSILTLGFEMRMYDKEDKYFSERSQNKEALVNFVNQLTAKEIKQEDVVELDVRDYEEKVAALKEVHTKELAAMEKQLQVAAEKWKRQEERHKADQEQYRADQAKQEIRHREELVYLEAHYKKEREESEKWVKGQMHELETRGTSLHTAAWRGDVKKVQTLLQTQANIEASDENGWTPLFCATASGNVETVQALLKARANMEPLNKDGWAPLHVAASKGRVEKVQALLQANANIEPLNKDGWAPLHVAASSSNLEAVQALIRAQANINPSDKDGWTPLHLAAREGNVEMVQALIQAQAEITTTNKSGMTPLQVAASQGHLAMVQTLAQAEANIKKISDEIKDACKIQ